MAIAAPAAIIQFVLILGSFLALTYAYVVSDFSVINVTSNSHTAKPLLYKVSGVWGNHEGSMLLWALILSCYGAAIALFGGNLTPTLKVRVLGVQAMLGVGILAFILVHLQPLFKGFSSTRKW